MLDGNSRAGMVFATSGHYIYYVKRYFVWSLAQPITILQCYVSGKKKKGSVHVGWQQFSGTESAKSN